MAAPRAAPRPPAEGTWEGRRCSAMSCIDAMHCGGATGCRDLVLSVSPLACDDPIGCNNLWVPAMSRASTTPWAPATPRGHELRRCHELRLPPCAPAAPPTPSALWPLATPGDTWRSADAMVAVDPTGCGNPFGSGEHVRPGLGDPMTCDSPVGTTPWGCGDAVRCGSPAGPGEHMGCGLWFFAMSPVT